jgi:crotonobetainyl-CoA:carnitine CoA-transferase CaiB-like acyl-CoA transferase
MTAVDAAAGLLAALEYRAKSGLGQTVELSEHEVGVHSIPFDTLRFSYSGTYRPRSDELYGDSPTSAVYPCADGYVQFQEIRRIQEFLQIIGGEQLASDPRLINADLRALNRDVIKEAFLSFLADKKRWELFEECSRRRIVISGVPDMSELYELQPHIERDYFQEASSGALDGVKVPGPPVRFDDGEWLLGSVPSLGEHTTAILAESADTTPEGGRI